MGVTTNYGIPYPEPTDALVGYPATAKSAAQTVDANLTTTNGNVAAVKGALFRRSVSALTSDSNGLLLVPHGLGAGYTAVAVWSAGPQVGATGNVAAAFMVYLSVDATNVRFRIFRPDGTPFVGSVGVWALGI